MHWVPGSQGPRRAPIHTIHPDQKLNSHNSKEQIDHIYLFWCLETGVWKKLLKTSQYLHKQKWRNDQINGRKENHRRPIVDGSEILLRVVPW